MEEENNKKEEKESSSYERFMKVAGTNLDEVTMILRSHLLAEYYLDHIIISNMPRGDVLLENKFSFLQKLQIVESLNIFPKESIDSIKNLNSVRNACAHNLDYKITETDIDRIGRPYTKKYLEFKQKHFKSIKELLHWTLALPLITLATK